MTETERQVDDLKDAFRRTSHGTSPYSVHAQLGAAEGYLMHLVIEAATAPVTFEHVLMVARQYIDHFGGKEQAA